MTWTMGSMDKDNLNPREKNWRLLLCIITVENETRSRTRKERESMLIISTFKILKYVLYNGDMQ